MTENIYVATISPSGDSSLYHALFATAVSSVPDMSSYEEFEQVDEVEQLRRVINAQQLLLLSLNVQPDPDQGLRAIELRYVWDGTRLKIVFLGKGAAQDKQTAVSLAQELWADLNKLFPQEFYRGGLQPAQDAEQFRAWHTPFPLRDAQIVMLEKQVVTNRLLRSGQEYAVPHPYKWGISSMARLCKTLMQQERPHIVSILLVPWAFHEEEIVALNTMASTLRKAGEGRDKSRRMGITSTLAAGGRQVSSRDQLGQGGQESFLPDPQAKLGADVYEAYLERMERPLLFRPYIVADGSVDPSVVGALTAEMVGYIPTPNDPAKETPLPHIPRERWLAGAELQQARQDLQQLGSKALDGGEDNLMMGINGRLQHACSTLAKLPYLVDVQEASCAFRLPALLRRDEIGVPIHSGAFVTMSQPELPQPIISLGQRDDNDTHHVHVHDLTKHMLIVGTTGSGKTTTCLHILAGLATQKIPFLVIEPVNAEHNDYRALLRLPQLRDQLQIFTLGDEEVAPFRLNPFTIQRGVVVNEHISSMLTAFKAAIPMWEPLPRLFLKALNRTYYRRGWTAFRKPKGDASDPLFPTMRDFYRELSLVVDNEIEHEGEVKGNLRGASKLRIEALLEGSCGRILSTRQSLPIESWMNRPTILELRHIGDDEDKALMIAFVLMAINEYLDKGRSRQEKGKLHHVILIEEAHRLLENTSGDTSTEQSNSKGQAAQAFARALAENRKYGEGIIIAEQLPTKLVPDVIGNTGLKIMHRLTSADDRELMGRAMKFNEFQEEHVVALRTGQAVVYGLDTEEPLLIQAPNFWSEWEKYGVDSNPVDDAELTRHMAALRQEFAERYLPFDGCQHCPQPCTMRDHGEALSFDKSLKLADGFLDVCAGLDDAMDGETAVRRLSEYVTQSIDKHASVQLRGKERKTAVYCLFLHLKEASGLFTEKQSRLWEQKFQHVRSAE